MGQGATQSTVILARFTGAVSTSALFVAECHDYERFYPQNLADQRDDPKGITAFVVGTGGIEFYTFADTAPNSAARNESTYSVLKLTLGTGTYRWQFLPTSGGMFTDRGSGTCHS